MSFTGTFSVPAHPRRIYAARRARPLRSAARRTGGRPSAWTTVRNSNPRLSLGRRGPSLSDNGGWSAQRESNPLLRTGKPACSLEHLGRDKRVEGGTRTRACTGLQPVALPSWRPRQEGERSRISAHHRPPGTAHSEETERVELSERYARRRSGPVCRTVMHLVSRLEESGGIEPLT